MKNLQSKMDEKLISTESIHLLNATRRDGVESYQSKLLGFVFKINKLDIIRSANEIE